MLAYSNHDIESNRRVLGTKTNADFDARTLSLWGEVGKSLQKGTYRIEPNLTLKISNTRADGYSESGPFGLNVGSASYNSRHVGIGVRVVSNDAKARFRPYGFLSYERELGDENVELSNRLSGLSAFDVEGSELGKNILSARAGGEAQVGQRVSVFGEIGISKRSKADSKYIYGGVKYGW